MKPLPCPGLQNGQRLGSCGDFGHPFPGKHTDKKPLSPKARTKQPEFTHPSLAEERPESKTEHRGLRMKLGPNIQECLLPLRSKDYRHPSSHSGPCHARSGLGLSMVQVRSACEGLMPWRCADSSEEIQVMGSL